MLAARVVNFAGTLAKAVDPRFRCREAKKPEGPAVRLDGPGAGVKVDGPATARRGEGMEAEVERWCE